MGRRLILLKLSELTREAPGTIEPNNVKLMGAPPWAAVPPALPANGWLGRNGIALAATIALALLSRLGHPLAEPGLWLPSGLAGGLVLLWGWRVLPGLVVGAMLAEGIGPAQGGLGLALGMVAGLEPLVLLVLVQRWLPERKPFQSLRPFLLLVLAYGLANLLTTLLFAVVAPQLTGWPDFWGRQCGFLALAPLLLALALAPAEERWQELRSREWWLWLAVLALGWLLFRIDFLANLQATPMVLILPPLIVAAFRQRPPGFCLLLLAMAVVELALTQPLGFTLTPGITPTTTTMQRLVWNTQFITLLVLVVTQERRRMVAALEAQAGKLEQKVQERTRELMQANARLERLSQRDGLTGIANRRRFDQALQREWSHAGELGQTLSLAIFDVDHFKAYNDHYGHQAGDRVLRRVAQALAGCLRPAERHLLARYGGEEFVVLFTGLSAEAAADLALRMHRAVGELAIAHSALEPEGRLSISGGLATLQPSFQASAAQLVATADAMLYAAKTAGRNRLLVAPFEGEGAQDWSV